MQKKEAKALPRQYPIAAAKALPILVINMPDVLNSCLLLILSLQMDFAKECLKTYDALIHYIRKIRSFTCGIIAA